MILPPPLRLHPPLMNTQVRAMPDMIAFFDDFVNQARELDALDLYYWCSQNDTERLPVNRIRCRRDRQREGDAAFRAAQVRA